MRIIDDYAKGTCRMGQGADCCRFLVGTPDGLACAKLDASLSATINERYAADTMIARADNCPGFPLDGPARKPL